MERQNQAHTPRQGNHHEAYRLMEYLYKKRHHPPDNPPSYWSALVRTYFARDAKKRWCLSMCGDHNGLPPATTTPAEGTLLCTICRSTQGWTYEANSQVLETFHKAKFDSGLLDEVLHLSNPRKFSLPSGETVLEYTASQEIVYEKFRVLNKGQIRIIFARDFKPLDVLNSTGEWCIQPILAVEIRSWEFCIRSHDELRPGALIPLQEFLEVAGKYEEMITGNGSSSPSVAELQEYGNRFKTIAEELQKTMELEMVGSEKLNDVGFSRTAFQHMQLLQGAPGVTRFGQEQSTRSTANHQNKYQQEEMHPGLNSGMNNNNHHVGGQSTMGSRSYTNDDMILWNTVNLNHLTSDEVKHDSYFIKRSMDPLSDSLQGLVSSCMTPTTQVPDKGLLSPQQLQEEKDWLDGLFSPHPIEEQKDSFNGLLSPHRIHEQKDSINSMLPQPNNSESYEDGEGSEHDVIPQLHQELMNGLKELQSLGTDHAYGLEMEETSYGLSRTDKLSQNGSNY